MKLTISSPSGLVTLAATVLVGLAPSVSAQVGGGTVVQAGPPPRLSPTDRGPVGAANTTALFAQVAIGGGYTTVFTFLNVGGTATTGSLILTDSAGNPMNAALNAASSPPEEPSAGGVAAVGPSIPLNINPGGTQFVTAAPVSSGDPTKTGWARVESEGGSLGGVATFQYSPAGSVSTIAGVLASNTVENATIPVDNDDGAGRYSGFAIANTEGSSLTVRIVPVDANGSPVPGLSLSRTLDPGAQVAKFLHQEWNAQAALSFRGSVVLLAPAGRTFAVVALVQDQGLLTAIPVIPTKAPTIN